MMAPVHQINFEINECVLKSTGKNKTKRRNVYGLCIEPNPLPIIDSHLVGNFKVGISWSVFR